MNADTRYQDHLDKVLADAAFANDVDEVRWALSDGANPLANDSYALRQAAYRGNTESVAILIPVSDPKAKDSGALQNAALENHRDVVDLLYKVSDVDAAIAGLDALDDDDAIYENAYWDYDNYNETCTYLRESRTAELEAAQLQLGTMKAAGSWSPDPKEADAQFDRRFAEAQAQSLGAEAQRQQASARMRL